MLKGKQILLRPIRDGDWQTLDAWGQDREALWGRFQRHQMDHLPLLHTAYQQSGLLGRESGFLLIETLEAQKVIGFVRYTLLQFPDADCPYPEIGFGIPESEARGRGYAKEAVGLLVAYLLSGYPVERVAAFTDVENTPAQRVLEALGFQREGILRRAAFRDGRWCDLAVYGLLREAWEVARGRA